MKGSLPGAVPCFSSTRLSSPRLQHTEKQLLQFLFSSSHAPGFCPIILQQGKPPLNSFLSFQRPDFFLLQGFSICPKVVFEFPKLGITWEKKNKIENNQFYYPTYQNQLKKNSKSISYGDILKKTNHSQVAWKNGNCAWSKLMRVNTIIS